MPDSWTDDDYWKDLGIYTERIVSSSAPLRLIIAGPGTGKTYSFSKSLLALGTTKSNAIALTFINNLKFDLIRGLGEQATAQTFHGFCQLQLHRHSVFRLGISNNFICFPKLPIVIAKDWQILTGNKSPIFEQYFRNLQEGLETSFFLGKSGYYDAVGYDDSVYRLYKAASINSDKLDRYKLIIVDEYQDFNKLEVELINLLRKTSPILIAGDDDQALYNIMRDSDPVFIRTLFGSEEVDKFELPYCLRCTKVIVEAVNQIVKAAQNHKLMTSRVPKRYLYFPPKKRGDTGKYPQIKLVHTTIQSKKYAATNYFGKYIEAEVNKIPIEEIIESKKEGFPSVLIIGPRQYTSQVYEYLRTKDFICDISEKEPNQDVLTLEDALSLIRVNNRSNLGWRVILEIEKIRNYKDIIKRALMEEIPLFDLIPDLIKAKYLRLLEAFVDDALLSGMPEKMIPVEKAVLKFTSFEGAKGLSAQHVFIVGMQQGDLPKNDLNDLEVCKFIVALTRARKACHILITDRFSGVYKKSSELLEWIPRRYYQYIRIDKNYWQK